MNEDDMLDEAREGSDLDAARERSRKRYFDQRSTPLITRLALAKGQDEVIEAVSDSMSRAITFMIDYRFPISLYMAWRMRKRYKRKIKALK